MSIQKVPPKQHLAPEDNTGVHIVTISGISATNAPDCDVIDQPIVQDA